MNYDQALEYIYSLQTLGKKAGLSGIKKLMSLLGNPQKNLSFVHIAGTNGKGSTTAMTSCVLSHAGYKTGMFISPFIVDFRERIQIDGQMISEETFASIVKEVKNKVDIMADKDECPSFFEVVTAVAFCYFNTENCDIVCLEVGLGGRFDATNIIDRSLVSVITSISLDHTELLGDTIEKIAYEKCGILKYGGVCVSYPFQKEQVLNVIREQSLINNNRLVVADIDSIICKHIGYPSIIIYKEKEILLPLTGEHQVANTATVLSIIEELQNQGIDISLDAIKKGIEAVRFPARLELISREPDIIIDGAHNISGIDSLIKFIEKNPNVPKILLFGVLKDKEYKEIIKAVAPKVDALVATTPSVPRAMPSKKVYEIAREYCDNVLYEDDFDKAIDKCIELAGASGVVFVCGSLYLASDIRRILLKRTSIDTKQ